MSQIASQNSIFFRLGAFTHCCLLALLLPAYTASAEDSATLQGKDYRRYQDLRRQFYVAMAMPPAKTGIRNEHQTYYRNATRFLADIPKSLTHARTAILFRRGRIILHCNRHKRARADFTAAMKLLEEKQPDITNTDRLGGIPTLAEVKLYHALSFENEGISVLLDKLETLPENAAAEHKGDLKERLTGLALELDRQKRYRLEIRVYKLIKKFGLSASDADDPNKHIAILRAKLGDDAPQAGTPETDDDRNEER